MDKITLDQYCRAVEKELKKTDFYDNIILFCGERGTTYYNQTIEAVANAVVVAYNQGRSVEVTASELYKASVSAANYLMVDNSRNSIKH